MHYHIMHSFFIYLKNNNLQSCSNVLTTSPSSTSACAASCNGDEFENGSHVCIECDDSTNAYGPNCLTCNSS